MNNNLTERTSEIKTSSLFSKDGKKRYKLEMTWDDKKPKACIIMTYPSTADEYIIDQTTMLVRNNAVVNNFGGISIVNVFCTIDTEKPETDRLNSSVVLEECSKADKIIVAYGRGMSHTEQKEKLLAAIASYKDKLFTILDSSNQPYSHPLSPKAREWNIQKLT